MKVALAALALAQDEAGAENVSFDELHEALEAADISVKRESLGKKPEASSRDFTASPGFLNHFAIVASVTDSPSAGTRISFAMFSFP